MNLHPRSVTLLLFAGFCAFSACGRGSPSDGPTPTVARTTPAEAACDDPISFANVKAETPLATYTDAFGGDPTVQYKLVRVRLYSSFNLPGESSLFKVLIQSGSAFIGADTTFADHADSASRILCKKAESAAARVFHFSGEAKFPNFISNAQVFNSRIYTWETSGDTLTSRYRFTAERQTLEQAQAERDQAERDDPSLTSRIVRLRSGEIEVRRHFTRVTDDTNANPQSISTSALYSPSR